MSWHNPETNPPPTFKDVLLAVRGEEDASEGWLNKDGSWQYTSGHEALGVYAWTELPKCPRELEPAAIEAETEEVQS